MVEQDQQRGVVFDEFRMLFDIMIQLFDFFIPFQIGFGKADRSFKRISPLPIEDQFQEILLGKGDINGELLG